jgi:hypothetical protein
MEVLHDHHRSSLPMFTSQQLIFAPSKLIPLTLEFVLDMWTVWKVSVHIITPGHMPISIV